MLANLTPPDIPVKRQRLFAGTHYVESDSSDLVAARRGKLQELRARGTDPFPNDFCPTSTAAAIDARFGPLSREQLDAGTDTVSMAGRIVGQRDFGRAAFLHLQDRSGRLQVYVKREVLGDGAFATYKLMDLGDFAGVVGRPFRTRTGELTLEAKHLRLLSKALRPLPERSKSICWSPARRGNWPGILKSSSPRPNGGGCLITSRKWHRMTACPSCLLFPTWNHPRPSVAARA